MAKKDIAGLIKEIIQTEHKHNKFMHESILKLISNLEKRIELLEDIVVPKKWDLDAMFTDLKGRPVKMSKKVKSFGKKFEKMKRSK